MLTARLGRTSALIAFVFALLCAPKASFAQTTYYVSPTGSDSGAGTQAQPFQTIQRAANLVNAGDTVIVADGTYTTSGGGSCGSGTVVCVSRGGTSSAWVTFRAQNAGGAKIDGRNNTSAIGFRIANGAAYVKIDGFEIFGVGSTSGGSHGFMADVGHDIVLSRLNVHDIGRACTDTDYGADGAFIRVPNVTITRSLFHDIGRLSPGENGCQLSNTNYQNHDHGLYIDGEYYSSTTPGASNVLISDNIFYRHQHGWAIQIYPGTVSGIRILNNTFAFPNPYRDGHILIGASTSGSVIANNVFYQPDGDALRYYSGTQSNLVVDSNIVYGATLFSTTPSGVSESGTIMSNPMLVNVSSQPYDFHLQSSSPGIGVGRTFSDVTVDYAGNPRPSGDYDVGAYQTGTATPPPAVAAAPSISPNGGTFSGPVQVTLATSTSGAAIRYTTDGTTPTSSSPLYAGPFTVSSSLTVSALASATGMTDSSVARASFTIQAPPPPPPAVAAATPSISPNGGTFSGPVQVALATTTSGGTIHFTTDGTTATSSSPVYTGPFTVSSSRTVSALTCATGMTDSSVARATFQIQAATDTTAPAVAFTAPGNGASVRNRTTLAVNASDNVGVVRVQFYLDGTLIATDTSGPWTASYNFVHVSTGAHTLSAVASDAAGNKATASITVYK